MDNGNDRFKYLKLAGKIREKIDRKTYLAGERPPAIQELHEQLNISISTIYRAYVELEKEGLIEARPKSGYYVRPFEPNKLHSVPCHISPPDPDKIDSVSVARSVLESISSPKLLPLGAAVISPDILPHRQLARILKEISVQEMRSINRYATAEGAPGLRRQIALRTLGISEGISADDILITNGCMEALTLALKTVVQKGDIVAIENPTFCRLHNLMEQLGFEIAEVPVDPKNGLVVKELEKILHTRKVKACLFTPNFHNPLGTLMPDERKERLVTLLNRHEIPVIEDDVFSDLHNGKGRPNSLKVYDRKELVLTCSSYSKILTPGLRIGWIIPGNRFKEKVWKLKTSVSISTSALDQYVLSRFMSSGMFDRYLRSLRTTIRKQVRDTALAVEKHFPKGTRLILPQGGMLLWIQLPHGVNSLEVYKRALEQTISIVPGIVCSASRDFTNFIRINCGYPVTELIRKGIATLGRIVDELCMESHSKHLLVSGAKNNTQAHVESSFSLGCTPLLVEGSRS
ncbi:MAG: PLP-dependent aminotransferase family protein [Deltaproteobacteria bacterium]|nr:PLP-dependent aminotransferase family protein [Deltaproteobacteria bacterium]